VCGRWCAEAHVRVLRRPSCKGVTQVRVVRCASRRSACLVVWRVCGAVCAAGKRGQCMQTAPRVHNLRAVACARKARTPTKIPPPVCASKGMCARRVTRVFCHRYLVVWSSRWRRAEGRVSSANAYAASSRKPEQCLAGRLRTRYVNMACYARASCVNQNRR